MQIQEIQDPVTLTLNKQLFNFHITCKFWLIAQTKCIGVQYICVYINLAESCILYVPLTTLSAIAAIV